MTRSLRIAAVLVLASFSLGAEEVLWQIDLVPAGKTLSRDQPTLKGASYQFHEYPTGTLVSIKKSSVKQITKLTPAATAAAKPKNQLTSIRDLPMQGPKASPGSGRGTNMGRARAAVSAANAGTAGRTSSPD